MLSKLRTSQLVTANQVALIGVTVRILQSISAYMGEGAGSGSERAVLVLTVLCPCTATFEDDGGITSFFIASFRHPYPASLLVIAERLRVVVALVAPVIRALIGLLEFLRPTSSG